MAKLTYSQKWTATVKFALSQGYTMLEDECHMESPNYTIWHVDQLISALERKGVFNLFNGL